MADIQQIAWLQSARSNCQLNLSIFAQPLQVGINSCHLMPKGRKEAPQGVGIRHEGTRKSFPVSLHQLEWHLHSLRESQNPDPRPRLFLLLRAVVFLSSTILQYPIYCFLLIQVPSCPLLFSHHQLSCKLASPPKDTAWHATRRIPLLELAWREVRVARDPISGIHHHIKSCQCIHRDLLPISFFACQPNPTEKATQTEKMHRMQGKQGQDDHCSHLSWSCSPLNCTV